DAFDILAFKFPDLSLTLAGSAPGVSDSQSNEALEKLHASQKKWGERIQYHGHVKDISTLFSPGSIHICPSIWDDPSPNIILEAKALGAPSIGFARGGIPELIKSGREGYIVPTETAEALTEAIGCLIQAPNKIIEYGRAAQNSLDDRFNYQDHVTQWVQAVEDEYRAASQREPDEA
ncbi:MAG: glycosyltransferase, partial [Pseudomonadota bacterium]